MRLYVGEKRKERAKVSPLFIIHAVDVAIRIFKYDRCHILNIHVNVRLICCVPVCTCLSIVLVRKMLGLFIHLFYFLFSFLGKT